MLATNYPQRIPEFLQRIEKPEHRRSLLYAHLLGLASHELRRAYVENHGNADDLKHFDSQMGRELRHAAIHSTSHTPESLLGMLSNENSPAHSLTAAASKLAQSFQSPQAAIDFAAVNGFDDLPDMAKHRFYGDVLAKFAVDDPQAAGAWLATLPEESITKILDVSLGRMSWNAAEQAKDLIKRPPPRRPATGQQACPTAPLANRPSPLSLKPGRVSIRLAPRSGW